MIIRKSYMIGAYFGMVPIVIIVLPLSVGIKIVGTVIGFIKKRF